MTKRCVICGVEFETKEARRKTCGDIDCQYVRHTEYLKEYQRKRRETHRKQINEYNRKWMREYRERLKAEKQARLEAINSFPAEGYAERQKAKTVSMVGAIEV